MFRSCLSLSVGRENVMRDEIINTAMKLVYLSWRVCSKIVRITKTKNLRAYLKTDALCALIAANFSFNLILNDD